ncbi:MAG TPA: DUF4907 domain-containing protein [Sediminibacterium sp.]|nr:DUF4907 domain-containing protein [Sediminibacterium sp.]
MIKKNWVYILFAASVVLFMITRLRHDQADQIHLTVNTFPSGDGWGYEIRTNDSVYIHQPYMPAVSGRQIFRAESDARTIGNLVVEKIKKHQIPSITIQELDSCGIRR